VPRVTAGEARLTLSSGAVSTLPIDVQALAESLCGPFHTKGGMAKCHLVVPPGAPVLRLRPSHRPSDGSLQPLMWQATALEILVEPVATSCGIWDVRLSLDAPESQPLSPMMLTPAAGDPGHGLVAGVVELKTQLHLANPAQGKAVDYPLVLGLGLRGSWRLAVPERAPAKARGKGGLLVLNSKGDDDDVEECLPLWVKGYPELLEEYLALGCQLCTDSDTSKP
jgi:hypothetical protein